MNNNPTAFPYMEISEDGVTLENHSGMTLRDWFAGNFLSGAVASTDSSLNLPSDARQHEIDAALAEHWGQAARAAYIAADAMLAARKDA